MWKSVKVEKWKFDAGRMGTRIYSKKMSVHGPPREYAIQPLSAAGRRLPI
jgi:hypothetical protein